MKLRLVLVVLFTGFIFASFAQAYVQNISKTGYPLHWATEQVTFHVNMGHSWNALVKQAVNEWNEVNAPFHITLIVGDEEAPTQCAEDDKWNTIRWSATRCNGKPYGIAIAYTWWSYHSNSGRINEADIRFDQNFSWSAEQFYHVALHELGHALGLGHPNEHDQEVRAVMNQGSPTHAHLQRDDRNGVRGIYGTQWWNETDYPTELLGSWEFVHPESGEINKITLTHFREYTDGIWARGFHPPLIVSARRTRSPRGNNDVTHYMGLWAKEESTCISLWLFYEGSEMFTGLIAVGTAKDEDGYCTEWSYYDGELFRRQEN